MDKSDFLNEVKNYEGSIGDYFLNVYVHNNKVEKKNYFNDFTEKAIIAYNNEDRIKIKNYIFNTYILKSFDKLAENTINNNKLYYFDSSYDDFKHEVIAHMIEKIDRYDINQGKAFSYFYIMCRNYLILENNKNYAKKKTSDDITVADDDVIDIYMNKEITDELSEFVDKFVDYMNKNKYIFFSNERDLRIADSLIYMFQHRKELYSYKKKNIFVLLRERSKENVMYITKNLKIFKDMFYDLYQYYKKHGTLEKNNKFF